jgi:hypothetical protein
MNADTFYSSIYIPPFTNDDVMFEMYVNFV